MRRLFLLVVVVLAAAARAWAVDPWEGNGIVDDDPLVTNTLTHGAMQQHDLDTAGGPVDQDWMVLATQAGHSYEARITGVNSVFDTHSGCTSCAQFERVTWAGAIIQDDEPVMTGGSNRTYDRTIRWVATSTQVSEEFIRLRGDSAFPGDADSVYTIRFWDTTYAIPRWNAANGQVTVFLIQNMTQKSVTGSIRFFSASGTLLHEQPLALGENQLQVFNASGVSALVGQSGHAYVAHTAGYGGLSGKAVALEPSTGFTFDTPMQPIPD
ncbi:MAG: hypothetical protein ABW221_23370 [Vicinamibacteria bacterium]